MEQAKREARRKAVYAEWHAKQREAHDVSMRGTFTSICAARRGGKTYELAGEIALALDSAGRGEWVVYIAQTAQIGKELIWTDLEDINARHDFGWDLREHPIPTITAKTGARFKIVGCDNKSELGKLRGKKYKLVVIDEAKEISQFLRELVLEILRPAFIGVGGRMIIAGTPGRVCDSSDFWYAICHGLVPGWTCVTNWTIRDNPWVRDPEEELRKVRLENDWTEDCVIYQREYEGRWVSDDDERVYAYIEIRNAVRGLPANYNPETWVHVVGVDIGFAPDPTAWAVLASHPNETSVYLLHAETRGELFSDQVAEHTGRLVRMYNASALVMDSGGQGKPYIEDVNRRHGHLLGGLVAKPADKREKRDRIEVFSEELKASRIMVCLPNAQSWAHEAVNHLWHDERREKESDVTPNHCLDAALYAHTETRAYWHLPAPPEATPEERAMEALRARQKARQLAGGRRLVQR